MHNVPRPGSTFYCLPYEHVLEELELLQTLRAQSLMTGKLVQRVDLL
jgi:hypothetical protein